MWLNSGAKGSYTPLHDHAGLFSFVVYVKIPYTREEEHKLNNGNIVFVGGCALNIILNSKIRSKYSRGIKR